MMSEEPIFYELCPGYTFGNLATYNVTDLGDFVLVEKNHPVIILAEWLNGTGYQLSDKETHVRLEKAKFNDAVEAIHNERQTRNGPRSEEFP